MRAGLPEVSAIAKAIHRLNTPADRGIGCPQASGHRWPRDCSHPRRFPITTATSEESSLQVVLYVRSGWVLFSSPLALFVGHLCSFASPPTPPPGSEGHSSEPATVAPPLLRAS